MRPTAHESSPLGHGAARRSPTARCQLRSMNVAPSQLHRCGSLLCEDYYIKRRPHQQRQRRRRLNTRTTPGCVCRTSHHPQQHRCLRKVHTRSSTTRTLALGRRSVFHGASERMDAEPKAEQPRRQRDRDDGDGSLVLFKPRYLNGRWCRRASLRPTLVLSFNRLLKPSLSPSAL